MDHADCTETNTSLSVGAKPVAEITCNPAQPNYAQAFNCSATCNTLPFVTDWSVQPAGSGQTCTPATNTATTTCALTQGAIITVADVNGESPCNAGNLNVDIQYSNLTLTCQPATLHTPGSFTCTAAGGDQHYIWSAPDFVDGLEACNSAPIQTECSLTINEIDNTTEWPADGKFTLTLTDTSNHTTSQELTLLPPAPFVEDLYTIDNYGIAPGATQDIYLRLNAFAGIEDINKIEIILAQGNIASETALQNAQIFDITTFDPTVIQEESGSGSSPLFTMLYQIPIKIPVYHALTDGDYTFAIKIFDKYNQGRIVFLSTYVGTIPFYDPNLDGSIDILDIIIGLDYLLNSDQTPPARVLQALDIDHSRKIELIDLIKLIDEALKE